MQFHHIYTSVFFTYYNFPHNFIIISTGRFTPGRFTPIVVRLFYIHFFHNNFCIIRIAW